MRAARNEFPVSVMCEALGVTAQGYYAQLRRQAEKPKRVAEDERLAAALKEAHAISRKTYGTPRLKLALAKKGLTASRRRLSRLMRVSGIQVKRKKRFIKTTDSRHQKPIAPNLLERDFVAKAPNEKWVSDITYVRVNNRWQYFCSVIDLYSRRVVGRTISEHLDSSLVTSALGMALRDRKPKPGCIFHSDRGSQYASDDCRALLKNYGLRQSMSRKGNCWDNAVSESSFGRLKVEVGDTFDSDVDAVRALYEYTDVFHNYIRIHTALGMTPAEFEERNTKQMSSYHKNEGLKKTVA